MIRILTLSMLLVACGGPAAIDPELDPILELYFSDAADHGKNEGFRSNLTDVSFATYSDPDQTGECYWDKHGTHVSVVRGLRYDHLVATLYHELGHCIYGLEHSDGLMASTDQLNFDYGAVWEQITDEYWDKLPSYFERL